MFCVFVAMFIAFIKGFICSFVAMSWDDNVLLLATQYMGTKLNYLVAVYNCNVSNNGYSKVNGNV